MPQPIKVAIIEDSSDLLYLYKSKFKKEGYDVKVAANGQEGLQLIKDWQPDIILLDILMPIMGGAEMLALVRAEEWGSDLRVIVLTNISKDEAPPIFRFLHVDRYVVKAHQTPAQVVNIVQEVLSER